MGQLNKSVTHNLYNCNFTHLSLMSNFPNFYPNLFSLWYSLKSEKLQKEREAFLYKQLLKTITSYQKKQKQQKLKTNRYNHFFIFKHMSIKHIHRLLNLVLFQASNLTKRSFWIIFFLVSHCNITRTKRETDKEKLINRDTGILDI